MMPFAETFTWHKREVTGQDADGNDVYGETDVTLRGAFAPSGSTELVQGQLTVLTHDTLYLVEGSNAPGAQDEITARGVRRKVDGTPEVFRNPFTGWAPGAVVRLVKVSG